MLTFIPQTGSTKNIVYDDNGNMTSINNSCGTTTYTWDVRNRLVGISGYTLTLTSTCSSVAAAFKYDALGRRIEKTINGVTIKYVYDGLDIIQEKNASGTVTVNYIRTLNIDEPLARIKSTTIRHYKTDALGSVIGLTDDKGAVKTGYSYDPFGNVTITGEASDNPFQYTGRENDGTGLLYYRARYFSPELQHFISEDPIGLAGGINQYSYVINNPLRYTDPKGLDTAGCDGVPDWMETPYRLECCAKHDECYDKNNCSASSWYKECSEECDKCNKEAKKCFKESASTGDKDDPDKPNYYCRKLHKYVNIPGDFPDYKTAKAFCSSD